MSSRSQSPHPLTLSANVMYNLTPRYAFADHIINIVSALLSSCLVTQQKKMALGAVCVLGVTCCLLYSAISYSFPPPPETHESVAQKAATRNPDAETFGVGLGRGKHK